MAVMDQDDISELLLAGLHQEPERFDRAGYAALAGEDWTTLLSMAAEQRVQALLYHRLTARGGGDAVPAIVRQALRQAYLGTAAYNVRLQGELGKLARALQAVDVPIIPLKGMFLAPAVYGNIALREMIDIDVLVPQEKLQLAKDVLGSLGYSSEKSSSVEAEVLEKHHLSRLATANLTVELHWNITRPGHFYTINPIELWQRAAPIQIAGSNMLTLSPEDLLLHLCQHTSYHHRFGFGLRPFCDIAEVIARYSATLDWDTLVRRAEQWGWRRGVYLALRLAQEFVGAAPPPEVLRRLKPIDFEEHLAVAARSQVLGKQALTRSVPLKVAQIWKHRSLWTKGRILVGSVFLPRVILIRRYGGDARSWMIYISYLVHWKTLLLRYARTLWNLARGKEEATRLADQQYLVSEWLSKR